jgi:hypothetical protein
MTLEPLNFIVNPSTQLENTMYDETRPSQDRSDGAIAATTQRLDNSVAYVTELNRQLMRITDRVLGAIPEDPSTADKETTTPYSEVNALDLKVTELGLSLDRINATITRLESL